MFILEGIGCSYVHSKGWSINRPNGSGNYLFIHIETPSEIMVDGKWTYYSDPCFILFKRGQPQIFRDYKGAKYIDSWIHFDYDKDNKDVDDIELLFDELDIPCGVPQVLYNSIELSDMWHFIDSEFHQNGSHRLDLVDMKMKTLIYKYADILHAESGTAHKYNRFRKSFGELRNRIYSGSEAAEMNDITALAKEQNLSISYFEHIYKELFGVPVSQDIIKSRITYARYLLRSTNNSVQQIAISCGYDNIEHFTRQFRKITGFTPTEFKKQSQ